MIRTGSVGLDIALGGGWEPGTINEIWGDTGSGKTVLALHTVESVVRARRDVLWIDTVDGVAQMDHAPRVVVARMREAEKVFFAAWHACQDQNFGLVVVDSADYMARKRELDGDPDFVPHPQREYASELTSLKRAAKATGTVVLFVSQPRDKERQPVRGTGISEKVKYRVHLHPDVIHQDSRREIQATVRDVPGRVTYHEAARFTVIPGWGIDRGLELVSEAVKRNVIHKSGSWYHWPEGPSAHGIREMVIELRERTHYMNAVEDEIRFLAGIS